VLDHRACGQDLVLYFVISESIALLTASYTTLPRARGLDYLFESSGIQLRLKKNTASGLDLWNFRTGFQPMLSSSNHKTNHHSNHTAKQQVPP
jgi:hypothetical protein